MNTKDVKIDLDAMERAALAAKPGKWTWKQVGTFSTPGCAILWPDTSKGGVHYRRIDSGGGMEQADAEFIAAANPTAILELIRRLREAGGLRALCHECARKIDEVAGVDVAAKNKRIAALESELAACREDAERYRWLRGGPDVPPESTRWPRWEVRYWSNGYWNTLFAEAIDTAIDAVIRELTGEHHE